MNVHSKDKTEMDRISTDGKKLHSFLRRRLMRHSCTRRITTDAKKIAFVSYALVYAPLVWQGLTPLSKSFVFHALNVICISCVDLCGTRVTSPLKALSHECRIILRMRNECHLFGILCHPLKCDSCPFYPLNGRSPPVMGVVYTCYFSLLSKSFVFGTLKVIREFIVHNILPTNVWLKNIFFLLWRHSDFNR